MAFNGHRIFFLNYCGSFFVIDFIHLLTSHNKSVTLNIFSIVPLIFWRIHTFRPDGVFQYRWLFTKWSPIKIFIILFSKSQIFPEKNDFIIQLWEGVSRTILWAYHFCWENCKFLEKNYDLKKKVMKIQLNAINN